MARHSVNERQKRNTHGDSSRCRLPTPSGQGVAQNSIKAALKLIGFDPVLAFRACGYVTDTPLFELHFIRSDSFGWDLKGFVHVTGILLEECNGV